MFTEREPVTSSISQEISDIDLDGFPGNERVIIERITDITNTTYTTFIIQRFALFQETGIPNTSGPLKALFIQKSKMKIGIYLMPPW